MCLAIYDKAGSELIGAEIMDRAFKQNPDGIGISWVEDGSVRVFKTLKDLFLVKEIYGYAKALSSDSPILIHFRKET